MEKTLESVLEALEAAEIPAKITQPSNLEYLEGTNFCITEVSGGFMLHLGLTPYECEDYRLAWSANEMVEIVKSYIHVR